MFDNETEHLLLAGGILTLLCTGVVYATYLNDKHRIDQAFIDHKISYLRDRIDTVDDAVGELVPQYNGVAQEVWQLRTETGRRRGPAGSPRAFIYDR